MKTQTIRIAGMIAGILTTIAFVPQAIKIYRTKHTKDISLGMFIIFSVGVAMWAFYGIMLREYPIIIANITVLFLTIYILIMKLKYK